MVSLDLSVNNFKALAITYLGIFCLPLIWFFFLALGSRQDPRITQLSSSGSSSWPSPLPQPNLPARIFGSTHMPDLVPTSTTVLIRFHQDIAMMPPTPPHQSSSTIPAGSALAASQPTHQPHPLWGWPCKPRNGETLVGPWTLQTLVLSDQMTNWDKSSLS